MEPLFGLWMTAPFCYHFRKFFRSTYDGDGVANFKGEGVFGREQGLMTAVSVKKESTEATIPVR